MTLPRTVNGRRWEPAERSDELITAPPITQTEVVLPATVHDIELSAPLPEIMLLPADWTCA